MCGNFSRSRSDRNLTAQSGSTIGDEVAFQPPLGLIGSSPEQSFCGPFQTGDRRLNSALTPDSRETGISVIIRLEFEFVTTTFPRNAMGHARFSAKFVICLTAAGGLTAGSWLLISSAPANDASGAASETTEAGRK